MCVLERVVSLPPVGMEIYESISRALMRRRYRRLEFAGSGGFVVQPKRVKVAHLAAAGGIWSNRRRRTQRLRLRGCFRIVPGRLMAVVKAAAGKLLQVGRAGNCNSRGAVTVAKPAPPVLLMPKNRPLRSSANDVIDEVWFQTALRRSIAEGRLPI